MKYWFEQFGMFIRYKAIFHTLVLPMLGLMSIGDVDLGGRLLPLIAVSISFHCFVYVMNDIVDLPVDKESELRKGFPLVTQKISVNHAKGFVIFQILLMLVLSLTFAMNKFATVYLFFALSLMGLYNYFGKKLSVPLLTDFVQAVGWGFLVLYGAFFVADFANTSTFVLFLYEVSYIMLITGVHSGLRDIENDLRCGVYTTVMLFGVKYDETGQIQVPNSLVMYAIVLQVLLFIFVLILMANDWSNITDYLEYNLFGFVISIFLFSMILAVQAYKLIQVQDVDKISSPFHAGLWHSFVLLNLPVVLLFYYSLPSVKLTIICLFLLQFFPSLLFRLGSLITSYFGIEDKDGYKQRYF